MARDVWVQHCDLTIKLTPGMMKAMFLLGLISTDSGGVQCK